MRNLWQDVIYGARMLAKKPGFTLVAALSIALGIGANTVIFSLVNATLLGPMPYTHPERVAVIWRFRTQRPEDRGATTVADLRLLVARNSSFDVVGGSYQNSKTLSATAGEAGENGLPAERLACQQFTAGMWQVLGVAPRLGRVFTADEDRDTAPAPVVVISDRFWQRHYNAEPNVLGRIITIDGVKHTVIGVMPAGFDFLADDTDAFVPAGFLPAQISSNATFLLAAARLKPGVTWSAAREDVKRLGIQFAAAYPDREGLEEFAEQSEAAHEHALRALRDKSEADFREGRTVTWEDIKARNNL